jgi:hypothetical protein
MEDINKIFEEKEKGSPAQGGDTEFDSEIPTPPEDDVTVSEEYESALGELSAIVNSSDNTFKRDYVGVIWKDLTV